MPNFMIYCTDNQATPDARNQHYPQHREYLSSASMKIVTAGPLCEESGDKRIGSLLIVEADSLADARSFAEADPFYINKVWEQVTIHPYIKAVG